MDVLAQIDGWGAPTAAAAVIGSGGRRLAGHGPTDAVLRVASVTKLLTTYATLIAVEEGIVALDEPAGPPGATVRHLLAHASGYGFTGATPIARPGRRRIYSNTGIEVLAQHVEAAAGLPFAVYLDEAVLTPLGMAASSLTGSPAYQLGSTVDDLMRFVAELVTPTLIATATLAEATSVQFPGLAGKLPDIGTFDPLDWGLGFELRDAKQPHWTGTTNSPATYGHFGGSGCFLWVDPVAGRALVVLTDREFGPWALTAWPALSDDVLRF
ncbi:MAG TPA: serine hydrolase domain-containing protein [Acidimicrobiales bacterium]|nr:serine hydrolase domain-containing protein [Acidimicrobiales bacterium]